jgi:hypothetical protein
LNIRVPEFGQNFSATHFFLPAPIMGTPASD